MRLILGSLPSTPVSELRLETGIEPTHLHALWLSSNFVLKINDESSNPIAKFTSNMRKRTVKHRSNVCEHLNPLRGQQTT